MNEQDSPDSQRFGQLVEEQNTVDFPYYNGKPTEVPLWKWAVSWGAIVAGFLALTFAPSSDNRVLLIGRTLFLAIPLVTFALLLGKHFRCLFRKVRGIDVWYMFLFAILNTVLTISIGLVGRQFELETASNSAASGLAHAGTSELVAFYVGTALQLLGEELLVIIPFLAILSTLHLTYGVSRKRAVLWAWLISALWFGAVHLPTYHWNLIQSLLLIGSARIALTLAFIRTKNTWVSAGAHIINDWAMFTLVLLANKS